MEQLQQTLNEAIKMGWKPWNMKSVSEAFCQEGWMTVKYRDDGVDYCDRGYHDLFSKDSGVMEFMEWKDLHLTLYGVTGHYVNMCMMSAIEKINYFNTNAYLPGNVPSVD